MGLLVVALAPLLFFIPKLSDLLEVSASKAGGFYQKHYPGSFV
jgi:hypothetical protein